MELLRTKKDIRKSIERLSEEERKNYEDEMERLRLIREDERKEERAEILLRIALACISAPLSALTAYLTVQWLLK